jgi:hypothetical protein
MPHTERVESRKAPKRRGPIDCLVRARDNTYHGLERSAGYLTGQPNPWPSSFLVSTWKGRLPTAKVGEMISFLGIVFRCMAMWGSHGQLHECGDRDSHINSQPPGAVPHSFRLFGVL